MLLNRKKPVEVRRVGTTLVAAFHNSDPNLIWKFDLERNHSFTLALQGDEGDLELGVTSPKGEFYPVARFVTREDADKAFMAVQKALMKRKCGWLKGIFAGFGGLVLFLIAVLSIGVYVIDHNFIGTPSSSRSAAVPEMRNGVPLPADQVLKPPP